MKQGLEKDLEEVLKDTHVLVASGSLAKGLPIDYYFKIGEICLYVTNVITTENIPLINVNGILKQIKHCKMFFIDGAII